MITHVTRGAYGGLGPISRVTHGLYALPLVVVVLAPRVVHVKAALGGSAAVVAAIGGAINVKGDCGGGVSLTALRGSESAAVHGLRGCDPAKVKGAI